MYKLFTVTTEVMHVNGSNTSLKVGLSVKKGQNDKFVVFLWKEFLSGQNISNFWNILP